MLSSLGLAMGSLSWFTNLVTIDNTHNTTNKIDGSTLGAYFAYGNGIPTGEGNNKYGINKPRHLYNLAWLQYLGYFERNDGTQFYFEIDPNMEGDLDMEGWVLPPIGTEDHPFIGNFNGNGKIIKNLEVSNNFRDYKSYPTAVTGWNSTNYKQPHIIGLFGVVGNYDEKYNDAAAFDSSIVEIKNTGLSNVNVKTAVKDTLMGLVAGYVDGTMYNVAIDSGSVNVDKTADQISGNATTSYPYSNGHGAFTDNISDYTLVGYTTKKTSMKKVTDTIYEIAVSSGQEFNANAQGATQGWGGSIDMKSMYERLLTIKKAISSNSTYTYRTITTHPISGNNTTSNGTYSGKSYSGTGTNVTIGHFNYLHPSYSDKYTYLGGGKINIDKYYSYVQHVAGKIKDNEGHYLRGTASSNNANNSNAGSVSNTTSTNATTWNVTEGTQVYIYATMTYNNTTRDYYLYYYNNTTLRLGTGNANRTAFTKEVDDDGNIRYSYNGKYLGYSGSNWTMITIPENNIALPSVPNMPDQNYYNSLKLEMPANAASTKQIYYVYNNQNYYLTATTSSYSTSTTPFTTGWEVNQTNSSTTIKIYGQNYYLYPDTSLTVSSSSRNWTVSSSNSTYRFSYRRSSGWGGSTTYYLRFYNGSFTYGTSNSNSYLNVKTTQEVINEYNAAIDQQYQTALTAYNDAVYYRDVTYPGLLRDYEASLAATFKLSFADETITEGPDTFVDESRTTISSYEYTASNTTYFPLNVKKDGGSDSSYMTNGNYLPTDANTGYVIAGTQLTESTTIDDDDRYPSLIRVSAYGKSDNYNISNSFKYSGSSYSSGTIAESDVRTINATGDVALNVAYPNYETDLEKYSSSKTSLLTVLRSSANNYGLHFMDSQISMDHILKATNVSVLGESYGNPNDTNVKKRTYDLPVNSIDFNLKEKGYINFFAGSYYSKTVTSFFSLHQIFRLGEDDGYAIDEIKEIAEIYGNQEHKNWSYAYKYTDGTYSKPYRFTGADELYELTTAIPDPNTPYTESHALTQSEFDAYKTTYNYTKLFDTEWITNYSHTYHNKLKDLKQNYLYYYEIPMNGGEFCLGSVSGAAGGYLLYLDIGASAAKTQRTMAAEHFLNEIFTYSFPDGVALIPTDTITGNNPTFKANNSACVIIKATYKGEVAVTRDNANHVTVARDADYTEVSKPSYISDTIVSVVDPGADPDSTSDDTDIEDFFYDSKVAKETYRIQYYDYNVNYESLTKTIIEDTRTNTNDAGWTSLSRKVTQQVGNGDVVELTSESQITNATIGIYKYLGANNANNGLPWSYSDIMNTSSTIYYNGTSAVTSTAICSTLGSEIIVLYHVLEGTTTSTNTIVLELEPDEDNVLGTYYIYAQYVFIPVVSGNDVDFIVKDLGTGDVYFVDGNSVLENGKFVYVLEDDGTLLNSQGQVVTATAP